MYICVESAVFPLFMVASALSTKLLSFFINFNKWGITLGLNACSIVWSSLQVPLMSKEGAIRKQES